jgi:hypothetical protein
MKKDRHQTVVVARPVKSTVQQEDYFGTKCQHVSFICDTNTYVRAVANAFVATVGDGKVTLYAELPTMTVKVNYKGLTAEYVKVGQHVPEGFVIGNALGLLKLQITKVLEGTHVAPEFFAEEPEPSQ